MAELPHPHTRRTVEIIHSGKPQARAEWGIAVETAVEIAVNGSPFSVMMATPADLEDLAVGLTFTERVVTDPKAIDCVTVSRYFEGISVDLTVPGGSVDAGARRKRVLEGVTGCGLCGVESLAQVPHAVTPVSGSRAISRDAISAAFDALRNHQPLNQRTLSVHAAAWCSLEGEVLTAREDVGRHNALDKLIGARLRDGQAIEPGFIVMTSRCSYELVYKAVAAGASLLATLSAPTSLALDVASSLGLTLACRAGPDGICFFPEAAE